MKDEQLKAKSNAILDKLEEDGFDLGDWSIEDAHNNGFIDGYHECEKEHDSQKAYKELCENYSSNKSLYTDGFNDGYNKAKEEVEDSYREALCNSELNLASVTEQLEELEKANEWHKADVPTSPINKVVLGYIKDYNSKKFCLVKWNGEWWYDARTWNDKVKLVAWKEIVLPREIE